MIGVVQSKDVMQYLAVCLGVERELQFPRGRVDPIARFLVVRVDVSEPSDTASHLLELGALRVKEIKVLLLGADRGDCCSAVGRDAIRGHGGPTILVHIDLFTLSILDEKVEITLNQGPSIGTLRSLARKEGQYMGVD